MKLPARGFCNFNQSQARLGTHPWGIPLLNTIKYTSIDKTEALILEISKNNVIYDKTDRFYKDVTKRRDIYQEIGVRIGLTGKFLHIYARPTYIH